MDEQAQRMLKEGLEEIHDDEEREQILALGQKIMDLFNRELPDSLSCPDIRVAYFALLVCVRSMEKQYGIKGKIMFPSDEPQ